MSQQLPVDISPRPRREPRPGVTPARLWDAVLTARAALAHESQSPPPVPSDDGRQGQS